MKGNRVQITREVEHLKELLHKQRMVVVEVEEKNRKLLQLGLPMKELKELMEKREE